MRKFEEVSSFAKKYETQSTTLPKRATKTSAGYDFYSPIDAVVNPKDSLLIWTNVKAMFNPNEVLILCVTSGMGKRRVMISNTIGVIDCDYYGNPSNDGNIGINLYNFGEEPYVIKAGDKIGQGIFMPFLTVDEEEEITTTRVGGYGSTNK